MGIILLEADVVFTMLIGFQRYSEGICVDGIKVLVSV